MKTTAAYMCVNGKHEKRINTIRYGRKYSILAMLEGSSYTWSQLREFGWRCVKIKITEL